MINKSGRPKSKEKRELICLRITQEAIKKLDAMRIMLSKLVKNTVSRSAMAELIFANHEGIMHETIDKKLKKQGNLLDGFLVCQECRSKNMRSTITVSSECRHTSSSKPFYDEDGFYHDHGNNQISACYTCSNGHEWQSSKILKCWCGHDREA